MRNFNKYLFIGLYYVNTILFADVSTGGTSASLDAALQSVNSGPDFTLSFNQDVSLSNQVRAVNSDGTFTYLDNTILIKGNSYTLNGNGTIRGFFVGGAGATNTGTVTIQDLTFAYTAAIGGSSSGDNGAPDGLQNAAGGGLGAGGGLFVGENTTVYISNCKFLNCTAIGGSGGTDGGSVSGGGGMYGDGWSADIAGIGGGGGGFGGNGASSTNIGGVTSGGGGGGASGFATGNASGISGGSDFNGNTVPGNGVGGDGETMSGGPTSGGYGGGGGSAYDLSVNGANGGFGGGGGGSTFEQAGSGGFGGGGGSGNVGGNGGFGGGGGNGFTTAGTGGFGGGDGGSGGFSLTSIGGRGAGFGGAIFIAQGATLIIQDFVVFSSNIASPGLEGLPNLDSLAGNGALGQDIFMMSSSQIIFDLSSDVTLNNPIQGDQGGGSDDTTIGGLINQGTAHLTLSGANSYTGPTLVNNGKLSINGSVNSDVTVAAGAILGGVFNINQNAQGSNPGNLMNSGMLLPGTSGLGIINIAGNFTNSGTLMIDITPTGNPQDKMFLSAQTTTLGLNSTLQVTINPGNYISGTQYVVINAPVSGTFTNFITMGALASGVQVQLAYSSVILTIINNAIFTHQIINPGIPREVADCIKSATIVPGSDFASMVELLGMLSNSQVNQALIELSPVLFGSLEWINARNNNYVADLLAQHLFDLRCSPRNGKEHNPNSSFWITPFGNFIDNKKHFDNLSPFDADAWGLMSGVDYYFASHFIAGASFGYINTHFNWKGDRGNGHINSYYGALYGSYQNSHFSMDVSAIGGGSDHSMERKIDFSTVKRVAKSNVWGYFFTGHLGSQAHWDWMSCTFEPFALIDYDYFNRKHFNETGAQSLDLRVKSRVEHMLRTEAGLKTYRTINYKQFCFAPYLGLSWVGEFPINDSRQKASFTEQSCVIDAKSYHSSVQLVSPQAGIKWTTNKRFSFIFGYKGLFNRTVHINEVEARLEWLF